MNIGMQAQQKRDQVTRSSEAVGCGGIKGEEGTGGVDLQKLCNVAPLCNTGGSVGPARQGSWERAPAQSSLRSLISSHPAGFRL